MHIRACSTFASWDWQVASTCFVVMYKTVAMIKLMTCSNGGFNLINAHCIFQCKYTGASRKTNWLNYVILNKRYIWMGPWCWKIHQASHLNNCTSIIEGRMTSYQVNKSSELLTYWSASCVLEKNILQIKKKL